MNRAGNRTDIRGNDSDIGIRDIEDLLQLDKDLVGCMQVLEMDCSEAVFDFLAVDIQCDDSFHSEAFAHLTEQCSGESLSGALLVLT